MNEVEPSQLSLGALFQSPETEPPYLREQPQLVQEAGEMSGGIAILAPRSTAPMLAHYLKIKQEYPEHLLLYQVGDFYEIFYDDAKIAADVLQIRLTSRNKDNPDPVPMCGVPVHAIDNYLPRLLRAGCSCVLLSQVEDTRTAKAVGAKGSSQKGTVRREITRIITPGVRYDGDGLEDRQFNYLAAAALSARGTGSLVYGDVSTGQLRVIEVESLEELHEAIERVRPAEVILPSTLHMLPVDRSSGWLREIRRNARSLSSHIVFRPFEKLKTDVAEEKLSALLLEGVAGGQSAKQSRLIGLSAESVSTVGVLLDYIAEVSFGKPPRLGSFTIERQNGFVVIDATTRRNLELIETIRDGERKNSLRETIDYTKTPMGARLIAEWILAPLCDLPALERRLDAVEELLAQESIREIFRSLLIGVRDLDRLLSRITTQRASPRDLRNLADSIAALPEVDQLLQKLRGDLFVELRSSFDVLTDLQNKLDTALVAEPPSRLNEGDIIRDGVHPELDRLRTIRRDGGQWLAEYEAREKARSGISGLKVRYNNVFGYSIEITKANLQKVPSEYERRQTLANAERYITHELKEFEQTSLSAKSRQFELERSLFLELREETVKEASRIQRASAVLAQIDVLCSFAQFALEHNLRRPRFIPESAMRVKAARHPVVERLIGPHNFVPNDIELDSDTRRLGILTGPNMGGKSTYLRQIGLIQLLAQAGSFVSADSAELGLVDRIFTRIGAADDLTRGDSTFMVEMREVTAIVKKATPRSLVLIDEVGRGTATTDGLAIATAIAEWLHQVIGCRTVFATHFHELTQLASSRPGMFCISVGVLERDREIVLTHRIEPKAADRSYGIEVARLAGLPEKLLVRAEELLATLERKESIPLSTQIAVSKSEPKPDPLKQVGVAVLRELRAVNTDSMTPLEALNELSKLKELVSE